MMMLRDNNYTFSLMIPIYYIIIFSIYFTKKYFNKKISKYISIIIIIILTCVILYLYINKYNIQYILNWIVNSIIPIIVMQYVPNLNQDIFKVNNREKRKSVYTYIIGLGIMFIPTSNWYVNICSEITKEEFFIAEILIYLCGVLTILLNKNYVNIIFKKDREV